MTARLGVRARLTIFVSGVFTVAVVLGSLVLLDRVEHMLITETRANAHALLSTYLNRIYAGTPAVAVLGPSDAASFFYRDADGKELTESEYMEAMLTGGGMPGSDPGERTFNVSGGEDGSIQVDPSTGLPLGPGGGVIAMVVRVDSAGAPHSVVRGEDVLAVAQQVELAGGTQLEIGVSSPLRPVAESLATLRTTLWYVLPLLVAAVAGITWLAAQRALRPVHSITGRTRAITATNLSKRVPVPKARDDIRDLASTMNDMLARLERSQDQQRRFIADASHELRSPVAASRAQLEVALGGTATDWQKTAETVLAEQESLTRLIDDLLALGRLDEQGIGPVGEVDLADLVVADSHRPKVSIDIVDPVRVTGNQSLLMRALRNLVDNADRHATANVHLTLLRDGDRGVIHVDDDGPGVPVDQRHRIFDRFARADESRQRHEGGAGLGLAITSEVIAGHGGELTCQDSPLGGARFTISMPGAPGGG